MAKVIMRLGVLAAALALAACAGKKDKGTAVAVTELASSDVATAVRESIGEAVVVTGTLAPYRTAEVRAQVPGVLTGLRVDRGSRVSAGDVMAALQAEGVRSQALGAKAAVAAAQASVALALRQLESSKKLRAAGAMS
ncbi:MAG TPA: biotin/lipoyl-binding protein, partial [Longimicrobiales bacterium]